MASFMRRKSFKFLVAAAVVVAVAGAWFVRSNGQKKADEKPLLVKVDMGSIENTIASSGTLKPKTYVDVGAQVSGQLKKMHVQVGDVVTQGQLLAEIDAKLQESKVEASRAGIAALVAQVDGRKAALDLAKSNAARQERLRTANATSQLEYDTSVNNLASAQSALEQLQKQIQQSQASLSSDETSLNYAKIYAPAAGTVVTIDLIEGRTLNAVQQAPTILRISDLSTMTVEAEISEADISGIKKDMTVYFTTLGSGDRRWYSKVRQILPTPTVTNNVVLYTALFDVDNADSALFTDMTAQVFFITASAQNVVTVPVGALKYGPPGGGRQLAAAGAANAGAAPAAGAAQAAGGDAQARGAGGGRPEGFTPGQGRPPGGFGGGNGQGRRGGFGGLANANPNAPRPATATVMKADGTREERQVMIGVTSRVSAEVISGLAVGEEVIAGILPNQSNAAGTTTNNNQNNNRNGFPGGGFPGGGGGGFPGGGRF